MARSSNAYVRGNTLKFDASPDAETRHAWQAELKRNRLKKLDVPSWLCSNVVELIVMHERGYLEHCRRYARDAKQS